MWDTIKIVIRNLRDATYHNRLEVERKQLQDLNTTANTQLEATKDELRQCKKHVFTYHTALKAVVKRYGPSISLPTRCMDEAKALTIEMAERDNKSIWIRVKGKNAKGH